MSQRSFVESVASRCGVGAVSELPTSQSAGLGSKWEGKPVCDKLVRAAVGSFIWVSGMVRPDITNAARAVEREERRGRAARKIISYLYRTKQQGLLFSNGGG